MKCINCGKEINKRNKYCSLKCQKENQYKEYIYKWKSKEVDGMRGEYQISSYIKTYIFNKYNKR